MCELLKSGSTLGQYPALKTTHVKQQVRVIFTVHRHKAILPHESTNRTWQTILDIPEYCTSKINVMFHESHTSITRPALLVVVSNNVLIVRVRVFSEVTLDEITGFFSCKPIKQRLSLVKDIVESFITHNLFCSNYSIQGSQGAFWILKSDKADECY